MRNLAIQPPPFRNLESERTVKRSATEEKVRQLTLALRAAKLGSRPPVMAAITRLSNAKCREIYKEVKGEDPVKGQLPSDISFFVSSLQIHIESSWMANMYLRGARRNSSLDIQFDTLFDVYETYLEVFGHEEPLISFDRAFLLTRHLQCQGITTYTCAHCDCRSVDVQTWQPKRSGKCPLCALTK